jgi:DNA-binding XRE family transcriptional regulator
MDSTDQGFRSLRRAMGLTQREAASALGVTLRTYEDIERGANPARASHWMAMQWLSLQHAVGRRQPDVASPVALQLAAALTDLSRGAAG